MQAQPLAIQPATVPAQTTLQFAHPLQHLAVKIFADGADRMGMLNLYESPLIAGMTTNPTLMRNAGISDYEGYARDILNVVTDKPISFEVFSDEPAEMRR